MACCCSSDCIITYSKVANFNVRPYDIVNQPIEEIKFGMRSKWEYLWIFPINFAASLIAIALAPIAALIDLVSGIVFAMMSCCESDNWEAAKGFFTGALIQLTEVPFNAFTRLFYPGSDANLGIVRCLREPHVEEFRYKPYR